MKKNSKIKNIAILCSGGDAPGMNAAIRALTRTAIFKGYSVFGIKRGYSGLLEGSFIELNLRSVANIIQKGGTILKTSRCPQFFEKEYRIEASHILRRNKIDTLIVIGGEGSYTGAYLLEKETGFPVVCLPGTIDNDIVGTDYTIGFDTAVNTALESIDRIRDTASAHDRVFLVEVMGRTCGEIAQRVGIAGGAETIIVPEDKNKITMSVLNNENKILNTAISLQNLKTLSEKLASDLKKSQAKGKMSSIVIVAESGKPEFTYQIARNLKKFHKIDSRVVILGHVQRGGTPSAMDRYLASLMGYEAIETLHQGKSNHSIALIQNKITAIPLKSSIGQHKWNDQKLLTVSKILSI
jgi:6-phosphofructokinase 1